MTEDAPVMAQHEFGGLPTWKLTFSTSIKALAVERGATPISWQPRPGVGVTDEYESAREFEAQMGDRGLVTLS